MPSLVDPHQGKSLADLMNEHRFPRNQVSKSLADLMNEYAATQEKVLKQVLKRTIGQGI